MSGHFSWRLSVPITLVIALLTACDGGAPTVGSTRSDATPGTGTKPGNDIAGMEMDAEHNAPDRPVVAETLPYAEVDEQLVYGYFAFPADMVDPLPGVIVIHERWGLDDGVRALADRIAGQGYVVLAVDLYGGETASDGRSASNLMRRVIENPELANENIRQAHQFLVDSGQAPRIGALGWSFGGGWALNAALLMPDKVNAAVVYYGQVTDNEERLAALNAPVLGLFGDKDRGVTAATVQAFEQALENLGKSYEIEIYPDAGHAFADPSAANYNAAAAEQAWSKAMAFLDKHLTVAAE